MNRNSFKSLSSILLGTILEWYDFSLFASMSSTIAVLFFPSESRAVSLIATFAVFASGFLMRPLGAVIFGHIGDKKGRRKALTLTIWLMVLPTVMICLLPTYHSIGVLAPILLVLCRLIQGLAASGEYPGAMCYLAEIAPENSKGLWASFSMLGVAGGLLLGSVINAALLSILSEQQMLAWGWRLPFVLALPLGMVAWFIRYHLNDSPIFRQAKTQAVKSRMPIMQLLNQNGLNLFKATLLFALSTISFYLSFVYIVGYLTSTHQVSMSEAMYSNSISTLVMIILTPFFGWLSDKVKRKLFMYIGAFSLFVCFPFAFKLFLSGQANSLLEGQVLLAICIAMFVGPMSVVVVDMFSVLTRYSGVALSLNIGGSLFGGTCPLIAAYLVSKTGIEIMPVVYPMSLALVCLVVVKSINVPKEILRFLQDDKSSIQDDRASLKEVV